MVPTSVWIAINSFNELIQRRDRSHASKIPLTKYIQSWEFRSTHSDFTKIQAPWKWNKSQMKQLINSNKRNIQTYFLSKWQHCHHHYQYDQMSRNHEKTFRNYDNGFLSSSHGALIILNIITMIMFIPAMISWLSSSPEWSSLCPLCHECQQNNRSEARGLQEVLCHHHLLSSRSSPPPLPAIIISDQHHYVHYPYILYYNEHQYHHHTLYHHDHKHHHDNRCNYHASAKITSQPAHQTGLAFII